MSLNTLLESANPYQSLQSDAARLASKWEKTGLLEGLSGTHKNNMGMIPFYFQIDTSILDTLRNFHFCMN